MAPATRTGHIVCDASYDEFHFIAGLAGDCVIETPEAGKNDKGEDIHIETSFTASKVEIPNSNVAEILAIQAAAKDMLELIKRSRLPITHLTVHTDSLTAKKNIELFLSTGACKPIYQRYVEQAIASLKKCVDVSNLKIEKVKAHVRDHKASALEAKHNSVDRKALASRWVMQDHIFKPEPLQAHEKNIIAVLASPDYLESDTAKLYQLGVTLTEQADKIRLLFNEPLTSPESHPLLQGISAGAIKKGKNLQDMLADIGTGSRVDMIPPCEGGDRILVRHHLYQHDANILCARVAALRKEHNQALAGLDNARAIHQAVPNLQIKIPIDQIEALANNIKEQRGIPGYLHGKINHILKSCEQRRKERLCYYHVSASYCQELAFYQDTYSNKARVAFPSILGDTSGNSYFDWSTVPAAMIPDPVLGYLYQRLRIKQAADPYPYRNPLSSRAHQYNFEHQDLNRAGAVSRLLYGPESYSISNKGSLTGRREPPSQRLINLCPTSEPGNKDVAYWCDTLSPLTTIRFSKGVDMTLHALGVAQELIAPHMSKTAKKVTAYLNENLPYLEPPQIRRGLHQLFIDRSIQDNRALHATLIQHCTDQILGALKANVNNASASADQLEFGLSLTKHIQQSALVYASHYAQANNTGSEIERQAMRSTNSRASRQNKPA